jgi:hemoglobin-like flavoprotein
VPCHNKLFGDKKKYIPLRREKMNASLMNPIEELERQGLPTILEEFVVAAAHARPTNIYEFMEQWAAQQNREMASPTTKDDKPSFDSPHSAVKDSWAALSSGGKKAALGKEFHAMLLTQHPSLKESLFAGKDVAMISEKFIGSLDRAIAHCDSDALNVELRELGARHEKYGVLKRHYNYFITTMLIVVRANLPGNNNDTHLLDAYRVVLTEITDKMYVSNVKESVGAHPDMSLH